MIGNSIWGGLARIGRVLLLLCCALSTSAAKTRSFSLSLVLCASDSITSTNPAKALRPLEGLFHLPFACFSCREVRHAAVDILFDEC